MRHGSNRRTAERFPMAKVLDGPEGILEVASWLGGGTYAVMCAVRDRGMREALMFRVKTSDDKAEFERKLLRIADKAATQLECTQEEVDFVVSYLGEEA